MMLPRLALVALLGLSVPALVDVVVERPAIAQSQPIGTFQDDAWEVSLSMAYGEYYYRGRALGSSDILELSNVELGGTPSRRIYRWYNGNYTYQVVWRPTDPDFIRLQVFEDDIELLNRLLERTRFR